MKISDYQLEVMVDVLVNLIITRDDSVRNYQNSFLFFDAYVDEFSEDSDVLDIIDEINERDDDDHGEYWETMNFLFSHVFENYRLL